MDPLQWMGAVRMRVQTTDKKHNNLQVIHMIPVHRLTYFVKSWVFVTSKFTNIFLNCFGLLLFLFRQNKQYYNGTRLKLKISWWICLPPMCINWWTGIMWLTCSLDFFKAVWTHSDGTHSLQRIHWWTSNWPFLFYFLFYFFFRWRSKLIYILDCLRVHSQHFFGWTIPVIV